MSTVREFHSRAMDLTAAAILARMPDRVLVANIIRGAVAGFQYISYGYRATDVASSQHSAYPYTSLR